MNDLEEQIVKRLKDGDETAFEYLFDRYYSTLCGISFLYVKDDFLAETIVSDVIFHIWQIRRKIDVGVSLKSYLSRSVRNKSLDYLKQQYVKRKAFLSKEELDSLENSLLSDDYPLGKLLENELQTAIRKAVDDLPEECRSVFLMSRVDGLKREEIAQSLGISVNTVKYHLKKALSALRLKFGQYLPIVLLLLMVVNEK